MSSKLRHHYCLSPEGNDLVEHHLQIITERLLGGDFPLCSLILAGSFGRGEGVVTQDEQGVLYPVNDYDIVLIVNERLKWHQRLDLRLLRETLTAELGIWHLDFNVMTLEELSSPVMSMMRYDIKFASQVFYGDPETLQHIPFQQDQQISKEEILNLLVNRMVTLLEGHPLVECKLSAAQKLRQIAKVYFALSDCFLNRKNLYASRYQDKLERLAQSADDSTESSYFSNYRANVEEAWRMKHLTTKSTEDAQLVFWESSCRLLIENITALTVEITQRLETQSQNAPDTVLAHWRGKTSVRGSWISRVIALLRGKENRNRIEKRIYMFLSVYPDQGFNGILQFEIPALFLNTKYANENLLWKETGEGLIHSWYHSV